MRYLVDTDVVAGWLKGRQQEITLLRAIAPDGLALSLISYGELYDGIFYSRAPRRSEQVFRQFLRGVEILPLNRSIMKRFARVHGQLRQSSNLIGDPDILIGATALYHGLTIVTYM